MLKYGNQKQRETAVHDALHAISIDPTMDEHSVDHLGNQLWHHVDEHGDTPEMHKFLTHLSNMHDEMDEEE
jgi:hypothetical protein